jgi:hypothetical protein
MVTKKEIIKSTVVQIMETTEGEVKSELVYALYAHPKQKFETLVGKLCKTSSEEVKLKNQLQKLIQEELIIHVNNIYKLSSSFQRKMDVLLLSKAFEIHQGLEEKYGHESSGFYPEVEKFTIWFSMLPWEAKK